MDTIRHALDLLGRILIAVFFIPSGIEKITGYAGTAAYMTAHGVPTWLMPLVILTELGGGILLLIGWHTRIVSFLLGGFCVLAVLFFHSPSGPQLDQIIFFAELALGGALFVMASHGAGAWSLDARKH